VKPNFLYHGSNLINRYRSRHGTRERLNVAALTILDSEKLDLDRL
jgi:hypothetical protein